jgi:enamine deaminase RidA (YjgF/YER057c/UK114 family)
MKKQVATQNAPGAPFLSQAIITNETIFVSGQIHALPDNTLVGNTTAEKA